MTAFELAALLSTAMDLAVGAFVLFVPIKRDAAGGRLLTLRRLNLAVAAMAVGFFGKLLPWRVVGLNAFGLMRLVYLDLVFTAPLLGMAVLTIGRRRDRARRWQIAWPVSAVAWGGLWMVPIGIYASFIEPSRLHVEQHDIQVPTVRAGREPLHIGVLADIQTDYVGDYERDAIDRLMALKPDVIVLPGDLFHGTRAGLERETPAMRDLLGRLSAPGGVYFVLGNVDDEEQVPDVFAGTPVRMLVNEIVQVRVRDWRLTIGGVELACNSPRAVETIRRLESVGDSVRLLLAHYPDAAYVMSRQSRIDLLIAGHTHGGQVCLPLCGPPITLSGVPRAVAAGGLHEIDGRRLYVSRGLGHERGQAPRIRFLCPPEITLLTMKGP